MTYTPGTPLPNQTLASSQPEIRNNFLNITDTIGRNHVPPTDPTAANRGKHNIVQLPQQSSGPSTSATEGAIYTKDVGGEPNLFWRRKSNGGELRMTVNHNTVTAQTGRTFIPGGMMIQWGLNHIPFAGSTSVIPFSTAFSAPPYSITVQILRSNTTTVHVAYVQNGTVTASEFSVQVLGGTGSHDIYWMAIGPSA